MKKLFVLFLSAVLAFGVPASFTGCDGTASLSSGTSGEVSSSGGAESSSASPSSQTEGTESQPESSAILESSGSSEPEPEPEPFDWETDLPENHNMEPAVLEAMHQALPGAPIKAVVTIKNGVLVDEYYQEGFDKDSTFTLQSCSKSFTSALVGIALEEGLIESIDTPISRYFPQLEGDPKGEITIRNLLCHKSGLEWHEWTQNGISFFEMNQAENWVEYVLAKPLLYTPGTVFNYTTGGTHLLAAVLEQAVGGDLMEYAKEHLFAPLGMESVRWRADPQGILDGGNGIEMTARDAAKFGELYRLNGVWAGEQVVPAQWVEQSVTIQEQRYGDGGSYGFQWWIRPFGGYDTFFAMGAFGQFIFVVPELELVTVITADTSQFAPYPYFTNYVLAACK